VISSVGSSLKLKDSALLLRGARLSLLDRDSGWWRLLHCHIRVSQREDLSQGIRARGLLSIQARVEDL
jgi:hypothetical protein